MTQIKSTVDRAAMAVSGGLILLGVVVLGLVETLAGQPYGAAPLTNDAGEVIAMPLIAPNLRTGLVILGLVVLLLWGLYKLATPMAGGDTETTPAESTAD
ncbi:hypothetical protein SAMN05216559_0302 [Halomicrobium zhouii]|uniref:Uncharacterized protein n=1 Tax=Halomicrobium zhouii TaxID=767519 RepID=A0A1I6K769_9EURY|nr:hypothetical protein [Halomicrobium zhouii]SFR87057.1 hypothetical protein SAMN05216559_0302 [Halomicrobium zhouii]